MGDSLDVMVPLNQDTMDRHLGVMPSGSSVIYDEAKITPENTPEGVQLCPLPIKELIVGNKLAANTVAVAVILNNLGGNIGNASPIGDSPPLLIALDAQVVLRQGERQRVIPLEDYFIDYRITARQESEFIEKIIVPRASNDWAFRAYKVSKRLDDDISAVCGAFNLSIEDGVVSGVRIAFGGMAATPKRARACEAALRGKPWNQASIERACQALAEDFTPLSDFRASKEYRLLTAQNLLRKYFIEQQTPYIETRVTDYV